MPCRPLVACVASSVASVVCAPSLAHAQIGIAGGVDGGLSFASSHQAPADPAAKLEDSQPTLALGIDVAGYWMPTPRFGIGFAMAPAFFVAGASSTPGIDFALSPRLVWKPGLPRFTVEGSLVLSAFDDRCGWDTESRPDGCTPMRPAEPTGTGFGGAVSMMLPLWEDHRNVWVEAGPVLRYRVAHYEYEDGQGSFSMPLFQAAIGLRGFVWAHD